MYVKINVSVICKQHMKKDNVKVLVPEMQMHIKLIKI